MARDNRKGAGVRTVTKQLGAGARSASKGASPASADAVAAARAAGLRYVSPDSPGLRRRMTGKLTRAGKRFMPTFELLDDKGRVLRDEEVVARVRALAIPPAWKDVWICPDPRGHVQAVGRDARGRRQYRYHPRWREERDSTKYERMEAFGRALPRIRKQVARDLRLPGLPKQKVLAVVVRLLETTFMRVGNEAYARENHSYGLTTLQDRHVSVGRDEVLFHFRGKSGVHHRVGLRDPRMARVVRQCRDIPGHELFQYLDADGSHQPIGSEDVNAYIRAITKSDFTAKDFRTWAGTRLALRALRAIVGEPAATGRGKRVVPTAKNVTRAIETVAARLGNTPSVCRKCYVHPAIISSYLAGELEPETQRGGPRAEARALAHELDAEERAVLSLLRRTAAPGRGKSSRSEGDLLRQLERSVEAGR